MSKLSPEDKEQIDVDRKTNQLYDEVSDYLHDNWEDLYMEQFRHLPYKDVIEMKQAFYQAAYLAIEWMTIYRKSEE